MCSDFRVRGLNDMQREPFCCPEGIGSNSVDVDGQANTKRALPELARTRSAPRTQPRSDGAGSEMASVTDTLPAALGSSAPDDADQPRTVQKLVNLPVYCLSGAYAGFWPTMQWAAVLPLPAPAPPEPHIMRGGRIDIPAGAHVETSGPMTFEHVTFHGLSAGASVICSGRDDVSFSCCTFQQCGVVVTGGSTVTMRSCNIFDAHVALVVCDAHSSATLSASIVTRCGEGIVCEKSGSVVAVSSVVQQCALNGVHAGTQGSVALTRSRVEEIGGFGCWAYGRGTSAVLTSCAVGKCARGALWVGNEASAFMNGDWGTEG